MMQCPRCLSFNSEFKRAEILYEAEGRLTQRVVYLCWDCGENYDDIEDYLDGTDDDTKPSHDDAD